MSFVAKDNGLAALLEHSDFRSALLAWASSRPPMPFNDRQRGFWRVRGVFQGRDSAVPDTQEVFLVDNRTSWNKVMMDARGTGQAAGRRSELVRWKGRSWRHAGRPICPDANSLPSAGSAAALGERQNRAARQTAAATLDRSQAPAAGASGRPRGRA